MDQNGIFMTDIMLELTDRLQKRLAFDVTDGTAYLNDGDFRVLGGVVPVKSVFDLICDMGDNLYCSSAEISAAFFGQNRPVDLAGGHVGILCETFVDEALVMAEIQIGFRTVIGDKYLAMLDRVHGSGVDVDIRVKLLHGDVVAPGL